MVQPHYLLSRRSNNLIWVGLMGSLKIVELVSVKFYFLTSGSGKCWFLLFRNLCEQRAVP